MAKFNDCTPGASATITRSDVVRVVGKTGVIVEASRAKRGKTESMVERITIDIPGHGEIVVTPPDLELLP
ncbi:MAG: hypothetical protein ABJC74_10840 [Gemmatimonadota bacterium]